MKKKKKKGKARDLRVFACAFSDIEWAWNPVQEIQVSVTAMLVRQTFDQDLDPGDLWRFDWSPLSLILSCLIKTFSKALQRIEPDIIRSGRRYIEEVVEYLIKSSWLTLSKQNTEYNTKFKIQIKKYKIQYVIPGRSGGESDKIFLTRSLVSFNYCFVSR